MTARGGVPPVAQTTPEPPATNDLVDVVGSALPDWVPELAIELVLAALILAVSYYLSRVFRQVFGRRIARRFQRPSVTRTVLRSIQTGIVFVGVLGAFGVFGLGLGDLVFSVAVFSAVSGIVLAPIIGSVIQGLFVLSEQPYEIGDMIHLVDRDVYGFVEDITLRYTKIFTLDNTFLVVPNGTLRERDVVNFSAEDSRVRLKLDVQVTYESDIEEARRLVEEAAASCEKVIEGGPGIRIGSARYPAKPTCYIDRFADHGVNLRLRYWAIEPYKLLTMRSNVQTAVWERLDGADVEIAYPHSHLVFDDTSGEMQVNVTGGMASGDGRPGVGTPSESGNGGPPDSASE
jgi:small-conductance mechanosensitive channel